MDIKSCQYEMRSAFLGGFGGQLVSGFIWLISAALSYWISPMSGMLTLFFGSMLIFPLTQLVVRMMGSPGKVDPKNSLWSLGAQTAFTVPLNFILVGAATLYHEYWFYPAAMIVIGSHYLPFITLYGMRMFGALAALLVLIGVVLGLYMPPIFCLGGWITGCLLIVFAFIGRRIALSEGRDADSNQ